MQKLSFNYLLQSCQSSTENKWVLFCSCSTNQRVKFLRAHMAWKYDHLRRSAPAAAIKGIGAVGLATQPGYAQEEREKQSTHQMHLGSSLDWWFNPLDWGLQPFRDDPGFVFHLGSKCFASHIRHTTINTPCPHTYIPYIMCLSNIYAHTMYSIYKVQAQKHYRIHRTYNKPYSEVVIIHVFVSMIHRQIWMSESVYKATILGNPEIRSNMQPGP